MSENVQQKKVLSDERRYQYLISGINDYAIYMLDPQGHVSSWNAGANRFKGYVAQEILGEHFSRFYTDEDRDPACRRARCRPRWSRASTKPRAGACARTAPVSGPTW
jgi:PAS domain S-box-containing protein